METNPIIKELRHIAALGWNPEQKAYYEQRAANARPVECVRMRDVFNAEQMEIIREHYKAQQKMCYKNASDLINLIANPIGGLFFPEPIWYVEGTRIFAACCRLNTHLSNTATNILTRRLNGPCIGTFGKKCTRLASNWNR